MFRSFPLLLAKFIVRDKQAIKALAWTLVLETLVAGFFFLILPSETAYPVRPELGNWEALYKLADAANLTYNLVPSLHVTYTFTLAAAFAPFAKARTAVLVWIWPVFMAIATVLTHHHHIIDAAFGFILAALMNRIVMKSYLVKGPTGLSRKLRHLEEQGQAFTHKIMLPW